MADYFEELQPNRNWAWLWKFFRDLVGSGELRIQPLRVPDFEGAVAAEWPIEEDLAAAREPLKGGMPAMWVNQCLRSHFAWSDNLADIYADRYRSAYVGAYLLAALAVLIALLPITAGWEHSLLDPLFIASEFIIMLMVIWLLRRPQAQRWHQRWMEYRLLAELIRQARFLIPLGGGRPFLQVLPHLASYGDLTQTWMYWQFRAVVRATGIATEVVTAHYLRDCLDYLDAVVGDEHDGQLSFHKNNHHRFHQIHERLHAAALASLTLTVVAIGLHLVNRWIQSHNPQLPFSEQIDLAMMLLSAFLPALGAALVGIDNQGEFVRVAKRAGAMADLFERYREVISSLQSAHDRAAPGLKLVQLVPLATGIAAAMVGEVLDWRAVFTDRATTAL